jgi:hypothetical protein
MMWRLLFFDKALELKADSAEPLVFRARQYHEAHGNWKNVVADVEKAVKLDSDNQDLASYLENAENQLNNH